MKSRIMERMALLLLAGTMLILLGGCSGKSDLTGTWQGKMTLAETGKSISDLEFQLKQSGAEITGTMNFTKVEGGKVQLTGKRNGDKLEFKTEHKRGLSVAFTGTVQSGSKISGEALLAYADPKVPVKQDRVSAELTRKR